MALRLAATSASLCAGTWARTIPHAPAVRADLLTADHPPKSWGCERCGAGDHSTRFCIQGNEGNAGEAAHEDIDVTPAVHETDAEIARSASEPDEPDVAARDSRSISAFVDARLEYGGFSRFIVAALMEHFDVRPKAAAAAELRSGVERWKARTRNTRATTRRNRTCQRSSRVNWSSGRPLQAQRHQLRRQSRRRTAPARSARPSRNFPRPRNTRRSRLTRCAARLSSRGSG
jgi:hypothetical protein